MKIFASVSLLLLMLALPLQAADIRVAAASDLNFAIKEIITQFERETGNKILLSLGSSGTFFAQILNGAPFDIFLSADVAYPRELEKRGLAAPGSTLVYGLGRLALWSSSIPLEQGMNALLSPAVKKIAIANPQHAPYGRAAVEAMKKAMIYEKVESRIVRGENIAQAAQFVQSGAADIGIIALSLALSDPMKQAGKHWVVPGVQLEQGAVMTKNANPAAKTFMDWLRSPAARKILDRYGFGVAGGI